MRKFVATFGLDALISDDYLEVEKHIQAVAPELILYPNGAAYRKTIRNSMLSFQLQFMFKTFQLGTLHKWGQKVLT